MIVLTSTALHRPKIDRGRRRGEGPEHCASHQSTTADSGLDASLRRALRYVQEQWQRCLK